MTDDPGRLQEPATTSRLGRRARPRSFASRIEPFSFQSGATLPYLLTIP